MPSPFTAALITGGLSTRMGQDKAFLQIGGRPLWETQLKKLASLDPSELLISARKGQNFAGTPARVVYDRYPDAGPLGGLATCMEAATTPWLLLLGIDLPLMTTTFLRDLTCQDGGAIFRDGDTFQPFAALYPTALLPTIVGHLSGGQLAMQPFIRTAVSQDHLAAHNLTDPQRPLFTNTNTPQELENATSQASATTLDLVRFQDGSFVTTPDSIAREEPLEIRVEGHSVAVTMRTPGHDEELAAGFLLTEGIISTPSDLFEISRCPSKAGQQGNVVDVLLTRGSNFDPSPLPRHVFTSSSCGLCGKATIDAVFTDLPPVDDPMSVPADLLLTLPHILETAQTTFQSTGGLHACALFTPGGELRALREDVGRHNALDKLLGHALQQGWLPLENTVLLLSGRVSFEMVQKALHGKIPLIAAISAPTSLAIELAQKSGQTLIGFLRRQTMNIYTGAGRIS